MVSAAHRMIAHRAIMDWPEIAVLMDAVNAMMPRAALKFFKPALFCAG